MKYQTPKAFCCILSEKDERGEKSGDEGWWGVSQAIEIQGRENGIMGEKVGD